MRLTSLQVHRRKAVVDFSLPGSSRSSPSAADPQRTVEGYQSTHQSGAQRLPVSQLQLQDWNFLVRRQRSMNSSVRSLPIDDHFTQGDRLLIEERFLFSYSITHFAVRLLVYLSNLTHLLTWNFPSLFNRISASNSKPGFKCPWKLRGNAVLWKNASFEEDPT